MKKRLLTLLLSLPFLAAADLVAQTVSTFAGSGVRGAANATGTAATFRSPGSVAFDAAGNLYVVDTENHLIRKITPAGVVTTFAGSPQLTGYTDATGTAARFSSPAGIGIDVAGNLYIADANNHCIRKITPGGVVSTFAGNGTAGATDGTGTAASFNQPQGVDIDANGNVCVADFGNQKIRLITPAGVVTTLAGSGGVGSADGAGNVATFNQPIDVVWDRSGNIYAADYSNNRIRKITPAGAVSTLAGTSVVGSADGTGAGATFNNPAGLTLDILGNIYIADRSNNTIRKITPAGVVTTYAGNTTSGTTDGTAANARFFGPGDVVFNLTGDLYVADQRNNKIRKIVPTEYLVAANPNPIAGGNPSGSAPYAAGVVVTLTANPSPGYAFNCWTEGTSTVSNASVYTFTMGSMNRNIVANYTQQAFNLSLTANPSIGGNPAQSGTGVYNAGAAVTLTANPSVGYVFNNWVENGTTLSMASSYVITVGTASRSITANYSQQTYNLSLVANPSVGGNPTQSGSGTYTTGATVTLTANPSTGYNFNNWVANGITLSNASIYVYTVGTASATITANYSAATGVNMLQSAAATARVYPNPAQNQLIIETESPIIGLSLYDMSGKMHQMLKNQPQRVQIDLANLPAGAYILQIRTEKGQETKQFVKE